MEPRQMGGTPRGWKTDSAVLWREGDRETGSYLERSPKRIHTPRISSSELRENWLLLEKIDDAEQGKLSKKLD
jgi:hypothetical protein